ncbi:MAG: hypothetical protein CL677_03035 [Bdellovibrionaceae bacterium]|nr:hypothetical protein [Pseudobdellovibrionaceae bacterium]
MKFFYKTKSIVILVCCLCVSAHADETNVPGLHCVSGEYVKTSVSPNIETDLNINSSLLKDGIHNVVQFFPRLFAKPWSKNFTEWSITIDSEYNGRPTVAPWLKDSLGRPTMYLSPSHLLYDYNGQLLSHEFIHILMDKMSPQRDRFIKEGVAMLGSFILTCESDQLLELFPLKSPYSLSEDFTKVSSVRLNGLYQYVNALFLYMYKHCGEEELFVRLLKSQSKKSGIQFLSEVLSSMERGKEQHMCSDFDSLFLQFSKDRLEKNLDYLEFNESFLYDGPIKLEPYSAIRYYRYTESCLMPSDLELNEESCMRIRFE